MCRMKMGFFAVGSAGALLGSLFTGSVARRVGVGLTIIGAAALSDAPPLALAFVTSTCLLCAAAA
jgi:hypothetical protein